MTMQSLRHAKKDHKLAVLLMKLKSSKLPSLSQRELVLLSAPGLEAAEILFDSIRDVLFCVKDKNRRYVAANEAFVRRARLQHKNELLGRTAREVFPAILAAGYEKQDEEVFSKGITVRDRVEMITQSGGAVGWFVSQKVAVKSASGEVIALAGISRDLDTPAKHGHELGGMAEVLETLHRDCSQPLRIEQLAKKTGLSWSQFERRIRNITGLTPRQLLTKSRIELAAEALRATREPLSMIACDCGFYDQAAFSRQFHSATGLTPGAYRKAFQG